VTEEAVINALCKAQPITGRDEHHIAALHLEETRAILQRHGIG
jgi:L-aminopeptidase/D-esterase-like protein